MNQFELIQYGYLGLLAMMLFVGGNLISTYITLRKNGTDPFILKKGTDPFTLKIGYISLRTFC